jgi:hypothetical protein
VGCPFRLEVCVPLCPHAEAATLNQMRGHEGHDPAALSPANTDEIFFHLHPRVLPVDTIYDRAGKGIEPNDIVTDVVEFMRKLQLEREDALPSTSAGAAAAMRRMAVDIEAAAAAGAGSDNEAGGDDSRWRELRGSARWRTARRRCPARGSNGGGGGWPRGRAGPRRDARR